MADAFVDIKYSQFFDRPKVMKAVKDGVKSTLSRAGAFVRQRAKTSIRKRKKIGTPGSPPSSHNGRLRDGIIFGYEETRQSVVVGPTLLKRANPTAPHVLEFGGSGKGGAIYNKFPFMQPALLAEKDKFPGLFTGAIKG